MTRDDLKRLCKLDIDFESIGLMEPGEGQEPYFCTPVDSEYVGRLGADGIHFVLLPEDERVFCVDPAMGEVGTYVLPVGKDLRQFLSFVLYCGDANPLSQIWWMTEDRFRTLLDDDGQALWPGSEAYFAKKRAALDAITKAFSLTPADPFDAVKAMQAQFDPSVLHFSGEYYDVLGLDPPAP